MIKTEYGIKAANLVWLIWDNTKKSPSCLFHWMTGGGFLLLHCKSYSIALQKLCYCIVKAMLLLGDCYAPVLQLLSDFDDIAVRIDDDINLS